MRVRLSLMPLDVSTAILLIILGSALFLTFSLIIACIVRTRECFMDIGQVLTMPTFFASNTVHPAALMPAWLQIVARTNPLTNEADALRSVMLTGGSSVHGLGDDLAVLALAGLLITAIATRIYPRLPA